MNLKKYYWGLNARALRETERILKDSDHPQYLQRMFLLLSRCDRPKEVFSLVGRDNFLSSWPRLRRYWRSKGGAPDFRAWWETVYEQLRGKVGVRPGLAGGPARSFVRIGRLIKERRTEQGLSQADLAALAGMKQPDVSEIELGNKNITLSTLLRLCRILKIKELPVAE